MKEEEKEKAVRNLLIFSFIVSIIAGSVDTFLPIYLRSVGFSIGSIGLLFSLGTIFMLASPIIGLWSDYLERRLFLKLDLIFSSIGQALYAVNVWLGRVVNLIGRTIGEPIYRPMLVEFADPKKLTSTLGLYGGLVALAWVGGPLITGYIIQATGFRTFFLLAAIFTISLIALLPKKEPRITKHKPKFNFSIGRAMKILLVIGLIWGIGEGIRTVLYSLVYSEFYGLNVTSVGFFIGISSIFYLLPILISRKKLDKLNAKWFIVLSLLLGVPISLAQYYITDFTVFYFLVLVAAANYTFFFPCVDRLIADASRVKFKAFDMALPTMTYMLGLVLGNLLSDPVSALFGVKGVFLFYLLEALVMLPLFLFY